MPATQTIARVAASFRDPSGFVFQRGEGVFRAVDTRCLDVVRRLQASGLLDRLMWRRRLGGEDTGETPVPHDALITSGMLVGTEIVDDSALLDELRAECPGAAGFLQHERIDPISYPYEWSPGMLADAGVLTLDLQIRLLESGLSLKDATAYNVQFVGGRPTFIDIASIERPSRLDVWIALGQFGRMFTLPLLLHREKGQSLRSYFLANLDGCDLGQVRRAFGRLELLRPRLLLDLTLPYWLGRRAEGGRRGGQGRSARWTRQDHRRDAGATMGGSEVGIERADPSLALEARIADPSLALGARIADPSLALGARIKETSPVGQIMNLRRLRSKLAKLGRASKPRGPWADYASTCSYADEAERAKAESIEQFLGRVRPRTVLDIGCNTGRYARLAAESGAAVVAVDSDTECVDMLYSRIKKQDQEKRQNAKTPKRQLWHGRPACGPTGETPVPQEPVSQFSSRAENILGTSSTAISRVFPTILPLCVDIANPSPAIGLRNRERPSFVERVRAECVFALALVHHLRVTNNLPLESIRDMFADLVGRYLVLEFVPSDDVMFRRLTRFRGESFEEFTLDNCIRVLSGRFELLDRRQIRSSPRTLLFWEKG